MEQRFVRPGASRLLSCGARGQNAAGAEALLAALRDGLAVRAVFNGDGAADPRPLVFCRTSGSTGHPKVIRRSQASWIASFEVNREAFALSGRDRYAVLGELDHSLSLYAALEALHLGADLLLLAGDSPRVQQVLLREHRATVLYATPAQLRRLDLGANEAGLPEMRRVFSGGGKLDAACRAAARRMFPAAEIREFYGASETSFIAMSSPDTPEGSVGRAYPGVTLEIREGPVDPRDGAGEIWVSSPYLFDGYDGDGSTDTRRDGAFLTVGEFGAMDAAGNLYLRGRRSRIVTVADQNVSLEAVEDAFGEVLGERAFAALVVADGVRGNAIICFVEGDADDALVTRVRQACRARLGAAAVPRQVRFLAALPMLPAGKPDLVQLAALAEAGA